MGKDTYVDQIRSGDNVEDIFLVTSATQGTTKTGNPFWSIKLIDRTGSIESKLWYPQCTKYENIPHGSLAKIKGNASFFNNQLQLKLDNFVILSKEEAARQDLADFKRCCPQSIEEMFKELKCLCMEEFQHPEWRKLILQVFNNEELMDAFKNAPAARVMHQAYIGGLLEHTLNVFKLCRQIANLYSFLDRQTLLAGALLHDIGKIYEFTTDLSIEYTDQGKLIGHTIIGLEILLPILAESDLEPQLKEHLKHLILSHHGEHEYGAAHIPVTAEAFTLHYADNLDAKLAHIEDLYGKQGIGRWRKSIDRHIFYPEHTPESEARNDGQENWNEQCLSHLKESKDQENPPF